MLVRLKNNRYYIIACILCLSILMLCASRWCDNDTFTMLATGKKWIESGILKDNTFTAIPGMKIIIEQWLWCVILSAIETHFGVIGLQIFNYLIIFLTFFLALLFFKLKKCNRYSALLLSLLVLMLGYFSLRPQMISIALLLTQCIILELTISSNWKWLFALPFIFILEINIHAPLWPLHILLVIPYLLPAFKFMKSVSNLTKNLKLRIFLSTIGASFCLFINPYGWHMLTYILLFLNKRINTFNIQELEAIHLVSVQGVAVIVFLFLLILQTKRRISPIVFYVSILFGIVSCTSQKQSQYLIIPFLYLLTENSMELNILNIAMLKNKIKPITLACLAALCSIFLISGSIYLGSGIYQSFLNSHHEPISYLQKNNSNMSPVFSSFNTGNILEYYNYKVFIDSRPELYLQSSSLHHNPNSVKDIETMAFNTSFTQMEENLNKYNFQYSYIGSDDIYAAYFANNPNWELVATSSQDAFSNRPQTYLLFRRT